MYFVKTRSAKANQEAPCRDILWFWLRKYRNTYSREICYTTILEGNLVKLQGNSDLIACRPFRGNKHFFQAWSKLFYFCSKSNWSKGNNWEALSSEYAMKSVKSLCVEKIVLRIIGYLNISFFFFFFFFLLLVYEKVVPGIFTGIFVNSYNFKCT